MAGRSHPPWGWWGSASAGVPPDVWPPAVPLHARGTPLLLPTFRRHGLTPQLSWLADGSGWSQGKISVLCWWLMLFGSLLFFWSPWHFVSWRVSCGQLFHTLHFLRWLSCRSSSPSPACILVLKGCPRSWFSTPQHLLFPKPSGVLLLGALTLKQCPPSSPWSTLVTISQYLKLLHAQNISESSNNFFFFPPGCIHDLRGIHMIYEKDIITMQCGHFWGGVGGRSISSDLCKSFPSFFSWKNSHHS